MRKTNTPKKIPKDKAPDKQLKKKISSSTASAELDLKNIVIPESPEKKELGKEDSLPKSIEESPAQDRKSSRQQLSRETHSEPALNPRKSSTSKIIKAQPAKPIPKKSPQELAREAKLYIESFYQPVADNIIEIKAGSNSRKYIFEELNTMFWPVLPMGYKWFYKDAKRSELPVVKKHSEIDAKNFNIAIFGPNGQADDKKKVNYITWFDDLNVQCYANTRPKKNLYHTTPRYPTTLTTTNYTPYDRGHGIDFADTITIARDTQPSATHLKNFIPEPVFWNQTLRRTWVGRIRKNGSGRPNEYQGAYMQRVYYHDYSLYNKNPAIASTSNGTPIPMGAFFSEIDSTRSGFLKAVDMSWSYDFNTIQRPQGRGGPTFLDIALPIFSIACESMPTALVYAIDFSCEALNNVITKYDTLADEKPPAQGNAYEKGRYNRVMFDRLYQAAETEYLTVQYKLDFSTWCAEAQLDTEAKIYLDRAKKHAEKLQEMGIDGRLSQAFFNLFNEYNQKKPAIFTDDQKDFWNQYHK